MEVKTAFSVLIGIVMTATILIAVLAIMGGLTQVMVEECEPAQYSAERGYTGLLCGTDQSGEQLRCNMVPPVISRYVVLRDPCIDEDKGLCCPVYTYPFDNDYDYIASKDNNGAACGTISGDVVRCRSGDKCLNSANNICIPQKIRVIEDRCCNIVSVSG